MELRRLTSWTVGTADAEGFSYDPIGRLSHDSTALGYFGLTHYGQTLQPTGWSLIGGGGLATNWSYLTNANDRRLASIANTPGRTYNFTTTPTDLITAIGEMPSPPGQNWAYGYDNANRLTGATSTSEGSYGYTLDPVGNVTQYGTAPATYNGNNELTNLNGTAFTWDAAGELVSDGSRTYSWDAAHRLIGISYAAQPGMTTAFGYDGLGRRAAMTTTVNGTPTTTFYVWCGHKLCQSQNADHTIARQYYREGEYIPSEQASLYYGPDQLGSVRDAYAASPLFNVPQAYDYDPTGNPIVVPTNGPLTDFHYAHMFYHTDSGLYLTEHRAYDPRTGRWLTRDPLGEFPDQQGAGAAATAAVPTRASFPDIGHLAANSQSNLAALVGSTLAQQAPDPGVQLLFSPILNRLPRTANLYAYAGNNPVTFIDPEGEGWRQWVAGCLICLGVHYHDPDRPVTIPPDVSYPSSEMCPVSGGDKEQAGPPTAGEE